MIHKLLIITLITFFVTFFAAKYLRRKFFKYGIVVEDKYKKNKPKIPFMGGMAILCGIIASIILIQVFVPSIVQKLLIFYFVVFSFAIFGILDDLINLSIKIKIGVPFFLALPIALLVTDTNIWFGFTSIELGLIYSFLIAPLYVMICSNLINMHSGFNGLSGGLSWILLFFVGLKVFFVHDYINLFYIIPIFASLSAFMLFNKYPSKFFLGDTGTLMLGASIGGLLILNNLEIFGIILFFPHIIDFILWAYSTFIRKDPFEKFGELNKDNSINAPTPFKLKFLFCYFFRLTEKQVIFILYGLTIIFGILGLLLA
jgi:UDP-N-acetylglucosamine--dolichyl-phosphate N-acetylglucosaminephosphotransferase